MFCPQARYTVIPMRHLTIPIKNKVKEILPIYTLLINKHETNQQEAEINQQEDDPNLPKQSTSSTTSKSPLKKGLKRLRRASSKSNRPNKKPSQMIIDAIHVPKEQCRDDVSDDESDVSVLTEREGKVIAECHIDF